MRRRSLPLRLVAAPVAATLVAVSVRRVVVLVAAMLPPRPVCGWDADPPSVALLVAARDEERRIGGLLAALDRLSYPPERLFVVLVDDGSADGTGPRLVEWAAGRSRALALRLDPVGKSEALNRGLAAAPPSDLVAVCDADLRPRREWLARLVEAFGDPAVGATASFLSPENPRQSTVSHYAAVEAWVHQLVTSAGKDRLGLDPPLGGGAAYRGSALEAVGGFADVASGEDVLATTALTRAGWKTRFVPAAVADNEVAHRWGDYWHQHVRWARNVFSAGSTGYLDRVACGAGLGLAAAGALPVRLPAAYLTVALAGVVVAVRKAGMGRHSHRFLVRAALVFPLDVAASAQATLAHLSRRPRTRRHARPA